MKQLLVLVALGLLGVGPLDDVTGAQTPSTPTVAQVLDKYIVAVGGRAALEKVTTVTGRGTIEIAAVGISGTVQVFQKAPNSFATTVDLSGVGETREGFDGTTAWESNQQTGLREKTGPELVEARANAAFPRELKLATIYPTMTLKGRESIAGRDAYLIEGLPAEGPPARMYFDVESGLLVRQIISRITQQGPLEVDAAFSDFRVVDGVKRPFSIRQTTELFTVVLQLTDVKLNLPIEDAVFRKPVR
jgi:hypothetical protein